MDALRGERILVTGPAGQIAFPVAAQLARENEVWGIARFEDEATRERCEAAGIQTHRIDLADPDFSKLPRDVTYVLHLAIFQRPGWDYDYAIRVNAEGTGLLMQRFASARAFLVVSTSALYAPPEDPAYPIEETDPIDGERQPYSPPYAVTKACQEAVARFAARAFGVPTTIARMNVSYGPNGGLPAQHLEAILAGDAVELQAGRRSICNPIYEDDIIAQIPRLLGVANTTATVVNWAGDDSIAVRDYCEYLGKLVGRTPRFAEVEQGISHFCINNSLRRELIGDCRVPWREGMRRMVAARHPELPLRTV